MKAVLGALEKFALFIGLAVRIATQMLCQEVLSILHQMRGMLRRTIEVPMEVTFLVR